MTTHSHPQHGRRPVHPRANRGGFEGQKDFTDFQGTWNGLYGRRPRDTGYQDTRPSHGRGDFRRAPSREGRRQHDHLNSTGHGHGHHNTSFQRHSTGRGYSGGSFRGYSNGSNYRKDPFHHYPAFSASGNGRGGPYRPQQHSRHDLPYCQYRETSGQGGRPPEALPAKPLPYCGGNNANHNNTQIKTTSNSTNAIQPIQSDLIPHITGTDEATTFIKNTLAGLPPPKAPSGAKDEEASANIIVIEPRELDLPTYTEPTPVEDSEEAILETNHNAQDMDMLEKVGSPVVKDVDAVEACSLQENLTGLQYKPKLPRFPPIWCQSRQEICETFDWFKSYQGGVYFSHNAVKGYLLSAFSASRDQFLHDGRLIISHGGGKAESPHSNHGQWVIAQADDQSAHDKSVRALLTNFRESRPMALVIDDKYALFPYDLAGADVTYAVLGLYTISDAWAEYQTAGNDRGRVIRYKFAFRWCEGQGEPWWTGNEAPALEEQIRDPIDAQIPDPVAQGSSLRTSSFSMRRPIKKVARKPLAQNVQFCQDQSQNLYAQCTLCTLKTPQVYSIGWACLNSLCPRFWKLPDDKDLPVDLVYNESFLRLPEAYVLPEHLRDIAPPQPSLSPDKVYTTYSFTRGSHCKKCGRLSCRVKLERWECVESFGERGKIRYGADFLTQEIPVPFLDHYINPDAGIVEMPPQDFPSPEGTGRVQSFQLPYERGFIQHIQANYALNGSNHADAIFTAYQEQAFAGDLPFRRWPMRAHKCRGDLLTNYFSQNSGQPYNYVGGTANTLSFDKTGTAVVMARDFIQARISQSLGLKTDFNEILSCAYMERQKMAFHSDSERGLGPVVAGLSLGAPALIHFRSHHKQRRGDAAMVGPGYQNQIVMSFVLRHGDVLVMNGAPVQDFYEHTVVPTDFRIAATARWIDPKAALPETHSCKTATISALQPTTIIEPKQE